MLLHLKKVRTNVCTNISPFFTLDWVNTTESVAKKFEFVHPFLNPACKFACSSPCPAPTILGVKDAVEPLNLTLPLNGKTTSRQAWIVQGHFSTHSCLGNYSFLSILEMGSLPQESKGPQMASRLRVTRAAPQVLQCASPGPREVSGYSQHTNEGQRGCSWHLLVRGQSLSQKLCVDTLKVLLLEAE